MKWENTVLDFRGYVTSQLSRRKIAGLGDEFAQRNDLTNEFKQKYIPAMLFIYEAGHLPCGWNGTIGMVQRK